MMNPEINDDNMNISQKIVDIDIILKMLNNKPQNEPLLYFKFKNQLEKKATSLADFWDTELYDRLELVESAAAQENAMNDDKELDDDLYVDNEETANEIKVDLIKWDTQKYADDKDSLYCDLMDNHVLSIAEIIERLDNYKDTLNSEAQSSPDD